MSIDTFSTNMAHQILKQVDQFKSKSVSEISFTLGKLLSDEYTKLIPSNKELYLINEQILECFFNESATNQHKFSCFSSFVDSTIKYLETNNNNLEKLMLEWIGWVKYLIEKNEASHYLAILTQSIIQITSLQLKNDTFHNIIELYKILNLKWKV